MPNEQTTVPLFTAGEVLTAADMNLSAGTGVPVFSNTTTRDAAFDGAGEKVLAEGQLCYLSDSNIVQYYTGAAWATVGPSAGSGLNFVTSATVGSAVSSVTVTGAFSATYQNYQVIYSGGTSSAATEALIFRMGTNATNYYGAFTGTNVSSGVGGGGISNGTGCIAGYCSSGLTSLTGFILNPFASANTTMSFSGVRSSTGYYGSSYYELYDTTSYTSLTILPGTGTLTGGTIRVYGYANS